MRLKERVEAWLPAALLVVAGLLTLAPHAPWAGLHLDDHGFHWHLSRADWKAAWGNALQYTPGRNLYILYYWAFYKLLGPEPLRLHLLGLGLDILNSLLAYALLRRIVPGRATALLVSGLFLVWPNHGETHFWTAAVGMNLLSTTFILLAFLAAGTRRLSEPGRLGLALVFFALALFDYDQAFFMWVPLLYHLSSLDEKPSKAGRTALAAACLTLCFAHFLIRLLAPYPGGSPTIRPGAFVLRIAESLVVSAVPMTKLPLWDSLQSYAGGPVPTIILILALAACWLALSARLWSSDDSTPRSRLAVLGVLWFGAAYLPNYFWYISPRHNYLPSLGFIMAAVYAASLLLSRAPRLAPGLAGLAFLLFGLSASATLAEGWGWKKAAGLHDSYVWDSRRLLPDKPDNIFLVAAPRTLLRAPAFSLTDEHLALYAYGTGHLPQVGDIMLTPTRAGSFYRNQPELYGPNTLYWRSYKGMNVLVRPVGGGSFVRIADLSVRPPGLPAETIRFCSGRPCAGRAELEAKVWLLSARVLLPSKEPAVFQAPNGVSLLAASARRGDGWLDLELQWRADQRPAADFASVARLYDAAGSLVFEPVYDTLPELKRRLGTFPRALWPTYNDLKPASGWKTGTAMSETFRLALPRPLPPGPLELRLAMFEKTEPGPWRKLGEFKAALNP
ncbi:MAG: hypothetical protein WC943_03450 [Elusimicrobiota bacterium]|jgi:hypothetical protein